MTSLFLGNTYNMEKDSGRSPMEKRKAIDDRSVGDAAYIIKGKLTSLGRGCYIILSSWLGWVSLGYLWVGWYLKFLAGNVITETNLIENENP